MKSAAKNRTIAVLLIAIGAVVIAYLCWPRSRVQQRQDGSVESGSVESGSDESGPDESGPDDHYRELVVGTWQDDYKGRRTLTVRIDGTATMVVEPDGFNALFASRLTFEEEWTIEGGQFKLKAIGGEPEARVRLILETMGNESDHKILELTTDRLLLLDSDGETQYDWRRTK